MHGSTTQCKTHAKVILLGHSNEHHAKLSAHGEAQNSLCVPTPWLPGPVPQPGHLTALQLCAHPAAAPSVPHSTNTRSLSSTCSAGLETPFKAGYLGLPHIPSWLPYCQPELLGATSVFHPETPSFTDMQVTGVTR